MDKTYPTKLTMDKTYTLVNYKVDLTRMSQKNILTEHKNQIVERHMETINKDDH